MSMAGRPIRIRTFHGGLTQFVHYIGVGDVGKDHMRRCTILSIVVVVAVVRTACYCGDADHDARYKHARGGDSRTLHNACNQYVIGINDGTMSFNVRDRTCTTSLSTVVYGAHSGHTIHPPSSASYPQHDMFQLSVLAVHALLDLMYGFARSAAMLHAAIYVLIICHIFIVYCVHAYLCVCTCAPYTH